MDLTSAASSRAVSGPQSSGHHPGRRDETGDVLVVDNLTKRYGSKIAVDSVSFRVRRSEIYAIVGPNGSGKTSTVECIEGLRKPDGGTITLEGRTPDGTATYNRLFGAQLQEGGLPGRIRAREVLELFAHYYRDPLPVQPLLESVGLDGDSARRYFDELSGGQKRRLMLALALLGQPPLLILDEPTSGLDPHARMMMWRLLSDARARGATILMTTHDMAEAEEQASRVMLMVDGRIRALGTPADLVAEYDCDVTLRLPSSDAARSLLESLSACRTTVQVEGALLACGKRELVQQADATLGDDDRARLSTGPFGLEHVYIILSEREGF